MKQSIGLVILQVFGIILGIVSVFLVAGSLPAEEYALVGVYHVISTIILVFSNTGFETYAIRNVLDWREKGNTAKIKLIVTQSITYRTLVAIVAFIPTIGYAAFVSLNKFDGNNFWLFFLMGLTSISKATNDATVLILKSFNKYFLAALVTYSINSFGNLLALLLFTKYGFTVYIYTVMLTPLLVTIPVIFLLRKYISFQGVFKIYNLKNGFIESKSFATSSYVSYAFNFLDQFLVSIFLSAEILGSFTVAKNILSIARTFVENFFDPMIQSLVSLKDSIKNFKIKLNKIFKIRNVLLVVSVIFIPFLLFFLDKALVLLRIDHYPYLNNYIILIYLSIIALIASKVKYTYISLFFPQESYLKIKVINALSALVFFIIVASISPKLLFLNTLLTNIVMFIYSEKYFNNKKNPFYNEVCNKR